MTVSVSLDDLAARLPEILRRVREGETFLLVEDGRPVAHLSPVSAESGPAWDTLVERLARVHTNDDSFAADLEAIQASQPPAEAYPWPPS